MSDKLIGPIMPEHLRITTDDKVTPDPKSDDLFGPQLPPHFKIPNEPVKNDDEDNGAVIGPILPGSLGSSALTALDERAEVLKYELLLRKSCTVKEQKRELWMTELPPEKAGEFGLGPRKFRTSYGTGDKSNRAKWTEIPSDKNKTVSEEPIPDNTFEDALILQRNEAIDKILKKSKKSKKDKRSLLERHQEKLQKKLKKKSKKDEKTERKPFDRDSDLQVNRFDEAQKKSIIKKAQLLNSRFSAGKSKYL